MKKKYLLIGLLILVGVFALAGCGKKKEEEKGLKLVVKETSWSGWDLDAEPKEKKFEYDVELNKEYVVDQSALGLIFEITEVNDDYIVIKTTQVFSDSEKGIDLNTKKKEFKVYVDKETKLTTPTMDAGNIYYLTLKK